MSSEDNHENISESLEFRNLQQKVAEINKKKYEYYTKWQNAQKEYSRLHNSLMNMCNHNWERDYSSFDPCSTCWECKKCGANK
jgi:hypothetical protein